MIYKETNSIAEIKPPEENILIRPDFVTDNAKCGSLNKAADNLIKRTQNEENKNVDQLQLKSFANPVNIETISKCNVFKLWSNEQLLLFHTINSQR